MTLRSTDLLRFFHSHYFLGGIRQTIGVLTPALVVGGLFGWFSAGAVASFGAACVAIIDQPGGQRQYGSLGMAGAIVLGTLTTAITGMATTHPAAIWFVIPALCFFFSMFTVFGRQGGLLGFACLLLMTLTMRTVLAPIDVALHSLYSLLGGLFYLGLSYSLHRLLWHRESLQALSVALFATADYVRARSAFYDMNVELDEAYRQLIGRQATMTDKHQAARDRLLDEQAQKNPAHEHLHTGMLNTFVDMVGLLDSLIATHTDYATLRRKLPDSDILLFARDALYKLSRNIERIALDMARNRQTPQRISVRAEIRAMEYELEKYKRNELHKQDPEVHALLVQILRRLRNATRAVNRMSQHARPPIDVEAVDQRLQTSLGYTLSRQGFRWRLLTSNLRPDSPHFRYAVRVTITVMLALTLSLALDHTPILTTLMTDFSSHSYWIVLTILVVMKPGFALTRRRNKLRLQGTLIGCAVALALLESTDNLDVYVIIMVAASILGFSFIQLSYRVAAAFNTIFVLFVFQFLSESGTTAIGERLFDTLLGCALALLCSYLLPWWERNYMQSLADAVRRGNRQFFMATLDQAEQARKNRQNPGKATDEAELAWRDAQQYVQTAFSNFASAFYRMMDEPERQQVNVPELNNLLTQHHILMSQITAAAPVLSALDDVPPGIQGSLDTVAAQLDNQDHEAPASIETGGELSALAYPVRQMVRASHLIRQDTQRLNATSNQSPQASSRLNTSRSSVEASGANS